MLGRYGRYELLRKVAAGGMAEVFLARYEGVGGFIRDVALKRLFSHLVEYDGPLEMFQMEARLLSEMNHPNIPQVVDLGMADDTWYIAIEWVDGWNLADLWRAGARRGLMMPLPVTVGVAMQVCEALHHAHEARDRAGRSLRLVHRDVTPHNVMVTRDGVAKLMDFGVAHTAARVEEAGGAAKGTYAYMAPETVKGEPIDRRADVFALGVILYELTTGTRLFRGNEPQVMTAIVEQDAPPPSARMPGYPPELEDIVMAALRRDPQSRIGSAADLALHLEHFAMRKGWMVGPRVIAHYVQQVFPAERLPEEALAMVPAEAAASEPARESAPSFDSSSSERRDSGIDSEEATPRQSVPAPSAEGGLEAPALTDEAPGATPVADSNEEPRWEPMSSDALLVDDFELEPASLGLALEAAFGAEDSMEPTSAELASLRRDPDSVGGPVVLLDHARVEIAEERDFLESLEARVAAVGPDQPDDAVEDHAALHVSEPSAAQLAGEAPLDGDAFGPRPGTSPEQRTPEDIAGAFAAAEAAEEADLEGDDLDFADDAGFEADDVATMEVGVDRIAGIEEEVVGEDALPPGSTIPPPSDELELDVSLDSLEAAVRAPADDDEEPAPEPAEEPGATAGADDGEAMDSEELPTDGRGLRSPVLKSAAGDSSVDFSLSAELGTPIVLDED